MDENSVPQTSEALYLAFRRLGYPKTIEYYGLAALLKYHTINDIVWTAWSVEEVDERTVYYRKARLKALVCSAAP